MSETWTIRRLLTWTTDYFSRKGVDSPRLTADLLLGYALGVSRVVLYTDFERPVVKDELKKFRELVERRAAGEPTHYLLGEREFYGLKFKVDARVLIPRPETEQLVELALKRLPPAGEARLKALDVCTGSGCIAVALAKQRPDLDVIATDLSPGALEVAKENAERNGVAAQVAFRQGDLLAPVPEAGFDLFVSNPPYVKTDDLPGLMREVQREPRGALDGGADGLVFLRALVAAAPAKLKPGGALLLEIGEDEGAAVKSLLEQAGLQDGRIEKDFAGLDRLALARRP